MAKSFRDSKETAARAPLHTAPHHTTPHHFTYHGTGFFSVQTGSQTSMRDSIVDCQDGRGVSVRAPREAAFSKASHLQVARGTGQTASGMPMLPRWPHRAPGSSPRWYFGLRLVKNCWILATAWTWRRGGGLRARTVCAAPRAPSIPKGTSQTAVPPTYHGSPPAFTCCMFLSLSRPSPPTFQHTPIPNPPSRRRR